MTQRRGKKTVQIGSEKEQRWRNKHAIPTKRQSNLSPQQETIFTEETPPQRTSAYPLTDRQRREQADRANDSPDIPASHGNRAAMWPKPCDKFHTFDLTSSRQCSRQQATINFTEATSVYKLYMERLQRQQEYKPRPSFLTELSHNYIHRTMLVVLLLVSLAAVSVRGHGRLEDPPGRSSMWRFGYDTPENYNDDECYCGSFAVSPV
ncbi:hypothetical protein LAZ67_22001437 [Cordylochernes scorpioides]|uniref:Uncharacterized protein n=1 Tax=Cordylochernes scorpioides TaxID=51811 RepID=A0ABY6LTT9_9ARAC|nr:hypothetical protein LAZ67_22001437 [Cordylochernes scorpioides]